MIKIQFKSAEVDDLLKENRTQEAVMVIRNPHGQFLLVRKSFYPKGIYRLPAGGIYGDETPTEALKRELNEEFKVKIELVSKLGVQKIILVDRVEKRQFKSHFFLLKPQEPRDLTKDEEHEDYLWVDNDGLKDHQVKLVSCTEWPDWGQFRASALKYLTDRQSQIGKLYQNQKKGHG